MAAMEATVQAPGGQAILEPDDSSSGKNDNIKDKNPTHPASGLFTPEGTPAPEPVLPGHHLEPGKTVHGVPGPFTPAQTPEPPGHHLDPGKIAHDVSGLSTLEATPGSVVDPKHAAERPSINAKSNISKKAALSKDAKQGKEKRLTVSRILNCKPKDYLGILELKSNPSYEQVRDAYSRLARITNPKHNNTLKADQAFKSKFTSGTSKN
jgi:hypothetical protein